VKDWEGKIVNSIAALYSVSPYRIEELKELLEKHKMGEEFTKAIFESLDKRKKNKIETNESLIKLEPVRVEPE